MTTLLCCHVASKFPPPCPLLCARDGVLDEGPDGVAPGARRERARCGRGHRAHEARRWPRGHRVPRNGCGCPHCHYHVHRLASTGVSARTLCPHLNHPRRRHPSPGAIVLTVPLERMLMAGETTAADEELHEGCRLSLRLLDERALGAASPLHGWISSLPPRVETPVHWPDAELRQLGCPLLIAQVPT